MKRILSCVALLSLVWALDIGRGSNTARAQNAPPAPQQGQNGGGAGGGPNGGNGQNGGGRQGGPQAGFHLIPRFAMQKLNLTDDQKTAIATLEKDTKAKLAAILTADQMNTLETARPGPPQRQGGQGGQGGPGGPPDNGPGQGGGGQGGGQGGASGGPPPNN